MNNFLVWLNKVFGGTIVDPKPVDPTSNDAPWMNWLKSRLGWTEFDHDKELSKYWGLSGLDYKTVIGSNNAWCALSANAALDEYGYKGSHKPNATSLLNVGNACDPKYGCLIIIEHTDGSHHVTFFNKWIDEKARIAECLGGNQSNSIRYSLYNLSGKKNNHDTLMGARWPVKK